MNDYERQKYLDAITELYALYRRTVFPSLPGIGNRAPLMTDLLGTSLGEAVYLLDTLLRCLPLPGDVCEFGICQGATSAFMANEIMDTGKSLWLYDSFQGLPKPGEKDELLDDIFGLGHIGKYHGTMRCGREVVEGRLERLGFPAERTRIVPGFLEETLTPDALPHQVCFAYLDMDFHEPTLLALRALHGRVPEGGVLMVDDYGFFSSGVKTAVHEFLDEHPGEYELTLPLALSGKFCFLWKGSPA
ncbi:TylF/MycF family methyltransferase [Fundidesulfovibrio soli]|uniref:TylF/MycF family methyltransferase n=1 Tax=Fundidesulfovibrio soli TaxID=2922716 RepID=UPI001FAF1DE6|nr:TylF/MycF family methyltransferase [Fundidesulfovibrio soli]